MWVGVEHAWGAGIACVGARDVSAWFCQPELRRSEDELQPLLAVCAPPHHPWLSGLCLQFWRKRAVSMVTAEVCCWGWKDRCDL